MPVTSLATSELVLVRLRIEKILIVTRAEQKFFPTHVNEDYF